MRSERIKGNVLLLALATQGFETYHLLGQFVIAQDQCIQGTALVGLLELALEATSAGIDLQALVASRASSRRPTGAVPCMH